ncbi:hypothetical protein SeMB42_g06523 [Synchytrium endobioticum]|uniref:Uncharacterized protein n=1 Tax=Synchytrium endobioticum TaxID=286115 RepID=A0A507CHP6_9FUNG|nr:hypothetical protein SeMB42_g06523 [Synchytrium endobioticum]
MFASERAQSAIRCQVRVGILTGVGLTVDPEPLQSHDWKAENGLDSATEGGESARGVPKYIQHCMGMETGRPIFEHVIVP